MQPRSWAQSTSSMALYSSQSARSARMSGVSECIENRLSVTTRMPLAVSVARIFCSRRLERVDVEMAVVVDVLRRGARAFLQAGMGQHVHHDVIVGAHEALHGGKAGRPAGRIEHDLAAVQELGDHPLELERMLGVAEQRGRAGAVHAVFLDGADGGALDLGMGGEAQVILRGEVDAGEGLAGVGHAPCSASWARWPSISHRATDRTAGAGPAIRRTARPGRPGRSPAERDIPAGCPVSASFGRLAPTLRRRRFAKLIERSPSPAGYVERDYRWRA